MSVAALVSTLALAASVTAPAPGEATSSAFRLSASHPLVILAPSREARRAALVVRFHAGSVDDGELPGLTLVTQHALLEANRRLSHPDVVRLLVGADATLRLETGLAECGFTLESGREDFARLAAVVLDLIFSPDLDPSAFASARRSAQHAEREGNGRDMLALIASKVVDDPAFLNPPTGTEAAIELIELGDVRRHVASALSPGNATVVIAGGFDPAAARRALARRSGGRALPRKVPVIATPFSLQIPARREIYLVAYRAPFATAEDSAVARLAAAMLEERIYWAFRGRGVGYSASVEAIHRRWIDLFAITLPARGPSGSPLGGLLEEEIAAIREGRFTAEELERNRSWILASFQSAGDDPATLAAELADGDGGAWFGPDVAQALRRLDAKAFVEEVGRVLDETSSIRILYSPSAAARGAIPDAYRRRGSQE
jgi:predicted Zn-dependent peptidase